MATQNGLFENGLEATSRRGRRHQSLFIPRYLIKAGEDFLLPDENQRNANEILRRWASLQAGGKLLDRNETEMEGEFVSEVFGKALGYTLFSADLSEWHIWPKFSIPGGQQADAAIGAFGTHGKRQPSALVELKGPTVDLDRSRFNGRTPVQQLWDYLNAVPDCPWGILCNYVSFRLYHRDKTPLVYQEFDLQDLSKAPRLDSSEAAQFREFYAVFQRSGLLSIAGARPRAERLLEETGKRQREVGPELYEYYADQRHELIGCLTRSPHDMPPDAAIRAAQKLLDRVIFIAFCEDRALLPRDTITKAWSQLPAFSKATNPRWQNFKQLFRFIDEGSDEDNIGAYDGNLFRQDDAVDDLELDDGRTEIFKTIGAYDFSAEVNEDVLGHIFEQSISDIERLRAGGVFALKTPEPAAPKMQRSALCKRQGIYYTHADLTDFIAGRTIADVVGVRLQAARQAHGLAPDARSPDKPDHRWAAYLKDAFAAIRGVKVCDPACGSGAFLIRAYHRLFGHYARVLDDLSLHDPAAAEGLEVQVPEIILQDNLFGVDLSPEGVEITQLALWLRSARAGKSLSDLSENIVLGNSLVCDPAIDPLALDWRKAFPTIFQRQEGGFDCVIGNPPWERMKLQEREFFDASAPEIASAVSAATRRKLIASLEKGNPQLYRRYVQAKESAEKALRYVRDSGRFPLTGVGDINTYAAFAELARDIVAPAGRVGLLVPSGIATDNTTRKFFNELVASKGLIALYDFENRKGLFADLHRSFKFSILMFGGSRTKAEASDFAFFAHEIGDLDQKNRHIRLSPADFKLLNPNTRTCPVFRTRRDAELTKEIYRRIPVLADKSRKKDGNPWGVKFVRMLDQTNDAELFHTPEQLTKQGFKLRGNRWVKGKQVFLPLYEAKMVQAYDHRAASVVVEAENWMRQGQTEETSLVQHQNPDFTGVPRFWVEEGAAKQVLPGGLQKWLLAYKDVTSSTNERTMIAAFIPCAGVMNSAPLIRPAREVTPRLLACLLGNLNSFVYDFIARQKVGGLHLNFFIVEQLPTLPPESYDKPCPWEKGRKLQRWISDRVLRLTCTAEDMRPLAETAGFKPPLCKWDPDERAQLTAELDAAYFLLYGVSREDADYVLSTFPSTSRETGSVLPSLTKRLHVLHEYDRLVAGG